MIPDGGFFGFNTSVLASRGLLGGLYQNSVQIYDDILKGYTEDVYVDVIEGYTIATIKLMGWFFVGSFIVFNGITLQGLNDTFGRSFSDQVPASFPLLQVAIHCYMILKPADVQDLGLPLEPDQSMMSCYRDRPSCLEDNLVEEVGQLKEEMKEAERGITG